MRSVKCPVWQVFSIGSYYCQWKFKASKDIALFKVTVEVIVSLILREVLFLHSYTSEIQKLLTGAFGHGTVAIVCSCIELAEQVSGSLEENPRGNCWKTNLGSPGLLVAQSMMLCGRTWVPDFDSEAFSSDVTGLCTNLFCLSF